MKKILALALSLSISVSGITMVSAATGKRLIGDVNGDGVISVADATDIQKYLANIIDLDDEARICADTDGNGVVSISDATTAQKYLAEIIEDFPANQTDPTDPEPTDPTTPSPTDPESKNIIPEGGQVILDDTTYNEGEEFPDNEDGMIFTYGDYEYIYGSSWRMDDSQIGWYVRVQERNKTSYGEILENINGSPVFDMTHTFSGCKSLKVAPTIPKSVTCIYGAFEGCTSLEVAPTIPNSVSDMDWAFGNCTSLTTIPTIPSSVTSMYAAFSGCTALTTAPAIPNSVTNMSWTFSGCTSIEIAPTIPNGVTNMLGTFADCTSLTTAPTIPSSVTTMQETFWCCTSLTGEVEINASNLENYDSCFLRVGNDIVLTGTCPILNNIASRYPNVSVKVA